MGYSNTCVNEPHLQNEISEIYVIACGDAEIRVETQTIKLTKGHILMIDPGGAHIFLSSSTDYLHFAIQVPGLCGEEALREKTPVSKDRLGI